MMRISKDYRNDDRGAKTAIEDTVIKERTYKYTSSEWNMKRSRSKAVSKQSQARSKATVIIEK
jgi:hypothetical protein